MRVRFAHLAIPALLVLGLAACTPAEALMWQPGHWDWVGTGYTWREGQWVKRAGHGTEWQDGYWSNRNGTWTWLPAHWM